MQIEKLAMFNHVSTDRYVSICRYLKVVPVSWTLMMSYPTATMMTMIPYWIPFPPANSRSLKQKTQQSSYRRHTTIKVLSTVICVKL